MSVFVCGVVVKVATVLHEEVAVAFSFVVPSVASYVVWCNVAVLRGPVAVDVLDGVVALEILGVAAVVAAGLVYVASLVANGFVGMVAGAEEVASVFVVNPVVVPFAVMVDEVVVFVAASAGDGDDVLAA